jgi:hypothetical protein
MKKKKNIFLSLAYIVVSFFHASQIPFFLLSTFLFIFVFVYFLKLFFLLRQSSAYNDLSLLNPDCDDDLVQIDEDNQELYVNKTGETCIRSMHEARLSNFI